MKKGPKEHSGEKDQTDAWLDGLSLEELKEKADKVFAEVKNELGFEHAEQSQVNVDGGN